jgi:hypothetical protein
MDTTGSETLLETYDLLPSLTNHLVGIYNFFKRVSIEGTGGLYGGRYD